MSKMNHVNQEESFAHSWAFIYSAYAVEKATTGFIQDYQHTRPEKQVSTKYDTDL